MKKALSIVLALTLLCALCVPAFAADDPTCIVLTRDGDGNIIAAQDATAIIKTTKEDDSGNIPEEYSVCFPASFTVPWNHIEPFDVTYKVNSKLQAGAYLEVAVARVADGRMTAADPNTNDLEYKLEKARAAFFKEVNVDQQQQHGFEDETFAAAIGENPMAHIEQSEFDANPIDEYEGTLQYTVTYHAP